MEIYSNGKKSNILYRVGSGRWRVDFNDDGTAITIREMEPKKPRTAKPLSPYLQCPPVIEHQGAGVDEINLCRPIVIRDECRIFSIQLEQYL